MSEEEMRRKMEFIVERQAQFAVDIQLLREVQAKTEDIVKRLATTSLNRFEDADVKIDAVVDGQIRADGKFAALSEAQVRADEKINALIEAQIKGEAKMAQLAEAQARTDELLKKLRHPSRCKNENKRETK